MLIEIRERELQVLLKTLRDEAGQDAVKITSKPVSVYPDLEAYVVWLPAFHKPDYNPDKCNQQSTINNL